MSSPIRPGDLAVVIHGPSCVSGSTNAVGYVFTVLDVVRDVGVGCKLCHATHRCSAFVLVTHDAGFELYRVQRLKPPARTEQRRTSEELTA